MDFDSLIHDLKANPGLDTLTADSEGIYRIAINDLYVVSLALAPDSSDYFLFATICIVPAEEKLKRALFQRFLECNLFGKETHKGYFALDSRQGIILLIRRFDTSIENLEKFLQELKDYVNTLVFWQEELRGVLTEAATVSETAKATANILLNLGKMV